MTRPQMPATCAVYTVVAAVFLLVMVIAHLSSPAPYLWTANTVSELAAQGYERAHIMQIGFVVFGGLVALGALTRVLGGSQAACRDIPVAVYGLAILASGLFRTSPFAAGIPYSASEAQVHSLTATLAGIAISTGILLCAVTDVAPKRRVIHLMAFALVVILSALFGAEMSGAGMVQRPLYLSGFGWLVFTEYPARPRGRGRAPT